MRKILVVIDMQNDFIDGALGTAEAQAVVPEVLNRIREYPVKDIFVTRDTHGEDYLSTAEGGRLPVIHCVKGTGGWELEPRIGEALRGAVFIDKPTFGSSELVQRLQKEQEKEPLEIELVGVCTDICVVTNALLLKTGLPETPVRVDASCCAGVTPESHEAALLTMKMCQVEIL